MGSARSQRRWQAARCGARARWGRSRRSSAGGRVDWSLLGVCATRQEASLLAAPLRDRSCIAARLGAGAAGQRGFARPPGALAGPVGADTPRRERRRESSSACAFCRAACPRGPASTAERRCIGGPTRAAIAGGAYATANTGGAGGPAPRREAPTGVISPGASAAVGTRGAAADAASAAEPSRGPGRIGSAGFARGLAPRSAP